MRARAVAWLPAPARAPGCARRSPEPADAARGALRGWPGWPCVRDRRCARRGRFLQRCRGVRPRVGDLVDEGAAEHAAGVHVSPVRRACGVADVLTWRQQVRGGVQWPNIRHRGHDWRCVGELDIDRGVCFHVQAAAAAGAGAVFVRDGNAHGRRFTTQRQIRGHRPVTSTAGPARTTRACLSRRLVTFLSSAAASATRTTTPLMSTPRSHSCQCRSARVPCGRRCLYCPQDREANHARTHYSREPHGQVA